MWQCNVTLHLDMKGLLNIDDIEKTRVTVFSHLDRRRHA